MDLVGLSARANTLCGNLSHGDQKLLDIALALALEPRVLLLDEPTAGMGPEERWQMIETVHQLWQRKKVTLIFIEHDMDIVFKYAQTIRVLSYGTVLAEGDPDAIRRNPAVIEAYLGVSLQDGRGMTGKAVFDAENIDVFYGTSQILFRVSLAVAGGSDHGAARPQRRRQVHYAEGDCRHCSARARRGPGARDASCRAENPTPLRVRESASFRRTGRCSPSIRSRTIC